MAEIAYCKATSELGPAGPLPMTNVLDFSANLPCDARYAGRILIQRPRPRFLLVPSLQPWPRKVIPRQHAIKKVQSRTRSLPLP